MSEKVVLVLLAVEAGAVKEGSGFLPSRRVLGLPSRRVPSSGSCHQGGCGCGDEFLKQVKGESTSLLVLILFMVVVAGRAVTGVRGSGCIGASREGQV